MERILLPFLLLVCATNHFVSAFNIYRDRIPNGHNVQHPCKTNTVWNGVGHISQQGGGDRNAFGLDFAAAGRIWTRSLCMKDSDGDGQTNGQELGDPQCTWTQGATPSRTTAITHPGFKTPASNYPYNQTDTTTLDCSGQYNCPGRDLADTRVHEMRMAPGTRVPNKTTTYYCTTYEVPFDQVYHGISFEPILDNLDVIHHMLVYGCTDAAAQQVGSPDECDMSSLICRDLLAVWSLGLPGQCSPPEAGVRFGRGAYRYFQIQVHWNNPQHVATYTDTSGIRMHYTPRLRQHDLGMLMLGQLSLNIPGLTPRTVVTSTCSPACANELFALGDISITSSLAHMHLLGKEAVIDKTDEANNTVNLVNEPVYDYNTPKWTDHRPYIRIGKKDRLRMTCTFDSSSRNKTTTFGDATDDEMCFGFLQYFPKRGDLRCVQRNTDDRCFLQSTVCGPRCPLGHYLDAAPQALARALVECGKIRTEGVCTQACANDLDIVITAFYDPCLSVRHRTAYINLLSKVTQRGSDLTLAHQVCFVTQKLIPVPLAAPSLSGPIDNSTFVEESLACPAAVSRLQTGTTAASRTTTNTMGSSASQRAVSDTMGSSASQSAISAVAMASSILYLVLDLLFARL